MYQLVVNIRELFYKLTPVKNKATLSNGQFEKLIKHPLFSKKLKMQYFDLGLIFTQVTGNKNSVNLCEFLPVLLAVYEQKIRDALGMSFTQFTSDLLSFYNK